MSKRFYGYVQIRELVFDELLSRPFVIASLFALTLGNNLSAQACSEITSQNRISVVHIQAEKTVKTTGAVRVYGGTGFIVSSSGVVLTNKHVVAPGPDTEQEVKISGAVSSRAGQHDPMHWLANSEVTDIAILQFDDTSRTWKPTTIGNPWRTEVGHPLCSMSFPLEIEFLMARGAVTGKGAPSGWWYSDMPSNPGDSGAPVFDASDGKVVGLKVGDRDDAKGLSYVIPINLAGPLLSLYTGVEVPREADRSDTAASAQYANSTVECKVSDHPFARGYCSVTQCPSGQWVRGSATLLPSGDVVVAQGLETDRRDLGICGWVQFSLLDSNKSVLGYGYNQRRCIGAKSLLGNVRIEDLPPDHVKVPAPIANRVASVEIKSFCAGDNLDPLGIGGNTGPEKGSVSIVIGASPKQ